MDGIIAGIAGNRSNEFPSILSRNSLESLERIIARITENSLGLTTEALPNSELYDSDVEETSPLAHCISQGSILSSYNSPDEINRVAASANG